MPLSGKPRWQSLLAVMVLCAILVSLAVAIPRGAANTPAVVARPQWQADPVYSIQLPYEFEPDVPLGQHRAQFTAVCGLCHSPRLALTQPLLTEAQWKASVHKMVAVYGAPLSPPEEASVVAYLMAVRGRTP